MDETCATKLRGKKILVVEDLDSSFELIRLTLSPYGIQSEHAINGDQALYMFKKQTDYDLIIMDIRLPGMNGHEVTRKIREMDQNIPIIANSAYSEQGEIEKAIQAGCNVYITKPTERSQFISAITDLLGHK